MKAVDPIVDTDLDAYVDGELDVARRIQVESYLSENPVIAAKVMADLSMKGELRLALAGESASGHPETRDAARRLERGLSHGRIFQSMQRIAAVGILVAAGWVAHNSFGAFSATEVAASVPAPAYVEDAVRAYQTAELRESMPSQTPTTYSADEIRAATAIVMPELPKGWKVADVQIFPSEFGPSVEMAITASDGKRLSLFAVRPGAFEVQPVSHLALEKAEAAYWQIGEVAYALIAEDSALNLDEAAERLARSLY
ncbi:anti-sigma factor [Rhizobium lentis]|uniref:anti-sigma factor family protein n=1 Tax=Rhizobium lentis TaxID=1138194 RepID=UPI001C831703|nr:anti-sigma factor [Rhizobium lentis]MBX4997173.1 anti-sigma factor [Rhizobium lentis]MBX5018450.1 anti-sigma factor [Rhizobium lentis]MBX5042123.1 anti-sigma factor [Rhizobium lentis]MBX5049048.1 anti-sigma factor [Rhizobium lentis]MBX5053248.1 anti-sigma factor [Rhizobium lentis]